jgi:hypothetical protein
MKMVPVYKGGEKILACHCDLEYYASIGWLPEGSTDAECVEPAPKKGKKVEEAE